MLGGRSPEGGGVETQPMHRRRTTWTAIARALAVVKLLSIMRPVRSGLTEPQAENNGDLAGPAAMGASARTAPVDSLCPAPSGGEGRGEGMLVFYGELLSEPKGPPLPRPLLPRREEREFIGAMAGCARSGSENNAGFNHHFRPTRSESGHWTSR